MPVKRAPASPVKHNHLDFSVRRVKISDEKAKTNLPDNTVKKEKKSDFWACLDSQDQAEKLQRSDDL